MTKHSCSAASESAQVLRDEGHFRASREQLLFCANDGCPAIIRQDCMKWLLETEERIPSVIFVLRDENENDVAGRVSIDGTLVPEATAGRSVLVDPGPHVMRFESDVGPPVETKVVIREREKDRVITVKLQAPPPETPPPATAAAKTPSRRGVPALSWALGGVAIAGGVGFALLWSKGASRAVELRDTCAPNCPESDISEVRTTILLAQIALGIGIAAAGGAVAAYFLQPRTTTSTTTGVARGLGWTF